ncbi:GSCOCG00005687001-RA-CDS [Cotesia congregata]|uniref:Similar to Bdp1: Transcription factor TFIIIB component B'' homolog (Mus musculus) n=1 Tax=Cotesia congregata TaxID=51543 RepID=A0A8J2HJW5_COTCN|nr:GSCOCG00005687001-RA-CDS [Cotesia congregata]CAG5099825.1 Similar to Bdp1: Transcription factor TFIIIB component B'' homolog (Mus musculus) [Cotesia congregata]
MFRSRVIVTANIQSRRPRNVVKDPDTSVGNTLEKEVNKQSDSVSDKLIKSEEVIPNNDSDKKISGETDKESAEKSDTVNNLDKKIDFDIPVPVNEAVSDAPVAESAVEPTNGAVTDGHVTTDVSDAETSSSEQKKNISSTAKKLLPRSCFMRPVPRLDARPRVRRNSVQGSGASASESEDDSRRVISVPISNPSRTAPENSDNNQCSLSISFSANNNSSNNVNYNNNNNNNNNNSNTDNESSTAGTKSNVKPKKKFVISESTRKLAEKKRSFRLEHKDGKPDRSKLTMYDLIHYNPSTNPMTQIETSKKPVFRSVPSDEEIINEDADDPEEPDEGGMPAPQVKIGPDGELILDEQSLVIERTSVIKQREALARTDAVIDDNIYGSGFYKQRARMKEWPKWETIKFYKALNAIGTDFSLMKSLFPKRTRSDLKRKYKKEEKANGKLVSKALKSGVNFDFDLLKEELETFEQMESNKKRVEKNAPAKEKKAKRRIAVTSLGLAALNHEDEKHKQDPNQIKKKKRSAKPPKPEKEQLPTQKKKKLKRLKSVSVHSDEDSADAGSESDTEIYRPRPTRSGRVPRPKKFRINSKHILDNILGDKTPTEDADTPGADSAPGPKILSLERDENSTTDITNMEPGSLVIVSKESPDEPGKTEVQVYMVKSTDDAQNNSGSKPDLDTDMISVVTKNLIASHRDDLDID